MKISINKDELYPYFFVSPYGKTIDIDSKTVKRWAKIQDSWETMQKEMEEASKR